MGKRERNLFRRIEVRFELALRSMAATRKGVHVIRMLRLNLSNEVLLSKASAPPADEPSIYS